MTMEDFSALLKRRIGLDAESIGMAAVERAVRQRAQATTGGDAAAYWQLLAGSAREQQELIETVVVPETSFFRHAESMDTLAVLARQRAAQGGALRILSLPCSSGEEPYTIAMALLDAGIDPQRFAVLGMDISDRLVARAEQGIYGRNAFRGEALDYRARHFTETPQGYSVSPRVRAHVRFQSGNLLDPGLQLPADAYDFVFCRNLLIYFDNPTQEAAVGVLRRLCRSDGVIFVGPAEASLLTRLGLKQIDAARAFAFRNTVEAVPAADVRRAPMAAGRGAAPGRPVRAAASPGRPRPSAPAARSAPARDREPPAVPPRRGAAIGASASMQNIQTLADAGRLDEARAAAAAHIETHGASAEAYYLVGLLADAASQPAAAETAYRKTLYLDPGHRQALLHLASLLETRGDVAPARQLRARAARHGNGYA
ncbi:CheR-type methyltransferase domain-containing protein [Bordetella sputigena]|uniref:CheR family methyltransferase n=1 Tax=Bordetella sputigena TaxID=1416810 RepID=UPI0039F0FA7C